VAALAVTSVADATTLKGWNCWNNEPDRCDEVAYASGLIRRLPARQKRSIGAPQISLNYFVRPLPLPTKRCTASLFRRPYPF
jgi:hypothetical protein